MDNDLHECKDSTKSDDSNETGKFICNPEYFCADYAGEAGSVSTCISWQHFPRSTSSRSRCDDSSESIRKSLEEPVIESLKKEKESTISSVDSAQNKSHAELQVLHYLKVRHVYDFLNFLLSHLVCNEPDDPVQFLENLLDKCLKYRDELGEPPLVFTHSHVKSLYDAFDPFERGYLSVEQYREAMKCLGLTVIPYEQDPPVNEDGFIPESDFIFDANNRLLNNLKLMLRIPKTWEENRLIWKKKMRKKKTKQIKKIIEFQERDFEGEEEDNFNDERRLSICRPLPTPYKRNVSSEPKQLYLN